MMFHRVQSWARSFISLFVVDNKRFYMPDSGLTLFAGDTATSFSNHSKEALLEKVKSIWTALNQPLYVNVNKTHFIAYSRIETQPYFSGKCHLTQKPQNNMSVRNILDLTWIVVLIKFLFKFHNIRQQD